MSRIDLILNLAGLLLWSSWLSLRFDPIARASAATLAGTLRRAAPGGPKRWIFLAGLAALVIARAFIYFEIGPAVDWIPTLKLGAIALSFRSDYPGLMLLYSVLGFVLALAVFYLSLLLISVANRAVPDTEQVHKLVRLHLSWIERWPALVKLLLPFFVSALCWMALYPLLARMAIVPRIKSPMELFEEASIIGASAYLGWKYVIVVIMLLHLVNSYVYLGSHPVWNFIGTTAGNLLKPLRWLPLQLGKVDFAPVVAVGLTFLIAFFAPASLTWLYAQLPLGAP